jgi:hypothetical protein
MGSWIVELQRREAAARERVDGLRGQIAELTERLTAEQDVLTRLEITRETMTDLLAETSEADGPQPQVEAGSGSPIGVVTVPAWRPGLDVAVLPVAYRDILEVLADADRPLRAGQIATALGLGEGAAKVEGLRSKLKRLAGRGWLTEQVPGLFAAASVATATRTEPPVAAPSAGVQEAGSSS